MKRIFYFAAMLLCVLLPASAQGLRHSVCVVEPEYSDAFKSLMGDYALYTARAGMRSASRALTAYKNEGTFGSGVVVEHDGKKYILTNLHVVGYAWKATIIFQLHEKTIRYEHCDVTNIASTDLAAIALPSECEMIALPVYAGEIEEDISIVAAGFPELADKPSWQLTRGSISNAHVDVDSHEHASRIIQHTASIDPGSSGGPLLLKNKDGKYEILGVNTWKAFYREGVGLAIGKEDVQAFIATLGTSKTDAGKEIEPLRSLSGEDWLYVFRQLPDSVQKEIRDLDWHLPLDPALRTLAIRDSIIANDTKSAKQYKPSSTRVETEMEHCNHVYLVYDNYLGINQQVGIQIGHDWWGMLSTGLQVTALITDVSTAEPGYHLRAGAMFCPYIGVQVPIVVGDYLLVPRVTQSGGAGPMKKGNMDIGVNIIADTRAGLDWHVPFSGCDLVLGLHYDMNWLWTKDQLNIPVYKTTSGFTSFNQYLQHGIGLTFGVAW